ncbi:MAG: hypothetical protein JST21_03360 [Bacteroidetes bacterium]|nr:hypothetical protein [Bacteroidota bacterium]
MDTFEYRNTTEMVINESGTLQEFYRIANALGKTRHVQLMSKEDDPIMVEWHYKYRGDALSLQYSIFNGVTLVYNGKDKKTADKLAVRLREIQ